MNVEKKQEKQKKISLYLLLIRAKTMVTDKGYVRFPYLNPGSVTGERCILDKLLNIFMSISTSVKRG